MRITEKYKKTEKELLLKFRDASQENNVEQMQQMAETLSRKLFRIIFFFTKTSLFHEPMILIKSFLNIESYQHYTHCVDAFIEQAVQQLVEQGMNDDIFSQVEGIYKMWFGPKSFGSGCGF